MAQTTEGRIKQFCNKYQIEKRHFNPNSIRNIKKVKKGLQLKF